MRWLFLALLSLFAVSASAQEASEPEWAGVWHGSIGRLPVIVCFDTGYDGGGRGSYYYRKHLLPIPLWLKKGKDRWQERPTGEDSTAGWQFHQVSPKAIKGEWSDGKRRMPIRLVPMKWQSDETPYMPCEAPAFMEPRLAGGEVVMEAGDANGIAFMAHEYRNPPHLDVGVRGASIFEEKPGDAAINAALARYVPTGTVNDDWVECMSGALMAHGSDGYFDRDASPTLLDDAFVTARIITSLYCGGAHPSHWTEHRVFDRQSGEEIDLETWLNAAAVQDNGYGSIELTEAFRAVIIANWSEGPVECTAEAKTRGFWDLELRSDGISFIPSMPHVMAACADPTFLDWSKLEPWLSDRGREGLARIAQPVG